VERLRLREGNGVRPARKTKRKQKPRGRTFRGLRYEADRWPDEVPKSRDLDPGELEYFLSSALESGLLTAWERGIADDVLGRIRFGRSLNDWHRKALDEMGVLRRCWDSDLDLWPEIERTR
jgi:hypothetical protein